MLFFSLSHKHRFPLELHSETLPVAHFVQSLKTSQEDRADPDLVTFEGLGFTPFHFSRFLSFSYLHLFKYSV